MTTIMMMMMKGSSPSLSSVRQSTVSEMAITLAVRRSVFISALIAGYGLLEGCSCHLFTEVVSSLQIPDVFLHAAFPLGHSNLRMTDIMELSLAIEAVLREAIHGKNQLLCGQYAHCLEWTTSTNKTGVHHVSVVIKGLGISPAPRPVCRRCRRRCPRGWCTPLGWRSPGGRALVIYICIILKLTGSSTSPSLPITVGEREERRGTWRKEERRRRGVGGKEDGKKGRKQA